MDTPTPSNDTLPHHQPRIFDMAESPTPVNATSTPSPPSSTSGKDFQNIVREPDPSMNHLLTTIFTNPTNRSLHAGVVFHDLTVTGLGLGASLQPTNSDLLLGPFRGIKALVTGKGFRPPATRTLLNGFTGCVRPGEMLLVLGRPGAGCSTFLKAIGNQRSGFQNVTGDVRYGGVDWRVMADRFRGEVLYNAEEDVHYATLTVRETLDFALKTRGSTRAARKEFLRSVAQLFWIEHTLDTKVGGEIVRGVSGGEKKRVSIAEAMATRASCQCWDNSTKGLDASTAMEYVGSLRALTDMAGMATCVALYQAGEQLGELFDKVILIEGGRCAYFGRMGDAKKYFEDLGFLCPPRWTTADFLTSVTDSNERHVKPGWEDRIPRNAEEFETAFRASAVAQRNILDIEAFEETLAGHHTQLTAVATKTKTKNYTIPFHQQVWACTNRQFRVMLGDRVSLYARWVGVAFQGLIVGSSFYQLPGTAAGVFPRGGLLFLTLLFNALLALAELTAAFGSRAILMKHKSFSFYRPSAYAIAQVVADIPLCAMQVLIWSVIVYFMADLRQTAAHFFIFLLVTFVLTLSMYSFFRMLGSFSDTLDSSMRITGVAIQALIVYTGYLIPPTSMHPWFSWLKWLNPVQYAFEALMANEFEGFNIECVAPYLVPNGPGVTPEHQSCLMRGSSPGSNIVNGGAYIETQYAYTREHLWRDVGIIIAWWILFATLTAVGLELQKPNNGGAAVTVFKRGQTPAHVEHALRGGTAPADVEMAEKTPGRVIHNDNSTSDSLDQVSANDTVFTWQNVNYNIPTKTGERALLQDVSGYVRPGRLCCLMGESGAGKTTLLNTLAQRITFGTVTGTFLVNGKPLPLSFQRATGFAEQLDIHEPTTTVREALQFSALLRQPPEVPKEEKYAYAEKIIRLLEMEDIAGATVGVSGVGLNQEQRKRLTIGVELASKPELLMFLDEPTSGLDSGAAYNIVRFLRKLADAGQAILCTIHQPSAVLFENFDEVILLKSGGKVVYHGELGEDSQTMIRYFEQNGAPPCPRHKNPAEYMLEAIGAGDPTRKEKDWAEVWTASPEHTMRMSEIEGFIWERGQNSDAMTDSRQFAMPISAQITAVMKRTFVSYWRNPEYFIGMLALHIFTGLFNSFTFYKLGYTAIDMQNRLFSVFMTLTISPPLIQQLQPRFISMRQLFIARENNSRIYHWSAFVISAIVVEIPYRLFAGTLYFVAWYFPIDFPRDSPTVAYTWLMMMLFELYYLGFGQAIASFAPNDLVASILVPVFFLFVISFCGVVVPYIALPYFWRSWMYWLSPFTYIMEGFLGTLTHNVPVRCGENEFARFTPPDGETCGEYVRGFLEMVGGYVLEENGTCKFCQFENGEEFARGFNIEYGRRWRDIGIVCAYVVFNFLAVAVFSWLYLGGVGRVRRRWGV